MDFDIENLMTFADVSEITKIKVGTLRKYVLEERIPFLKLNGFVRFQASEIKAWLEDNAHRPVKLHKVHQPELPVVSAEV